MTVRTGADRRPPRPRTGRAVESSPAVAGGIVYVGSEDMHVYAFSAVDGREIWKSPKLPGVSGFGAGLDHATRKLSLQVNLDSASSAKRAAASLPSVIEGLPVKISRRGPAGAD